MTWCLCVKFFMGCKNCASRHTLPVKLAVFFLCVKNVLRIASMSVVVQCYEPSCSIHCNVMVGIMLCSIQCKIEAEAMQFSVISNGQCSAIWCGMGWWVGGGAASLELIRFEIWSYSLEQSTLISTAVSAYKHVKCTHNQNMHIYTRKNCSHAFMIYQLLTLRETKMRHMFYMFSVTRRSTRH